ncbi:DUF7504 family protein [Haloarcula litorea]|uniref:DUF7504 family protein n=1 Tax=Haloarcula litorea TaxID=3032579 RepID=UPI0023E82C50|nr:hypothetical protein [Halomicroarcula sp. GDY20]
MTDSYRLYGLPLDPVPAGTNLLVTGDPMGGTDGVAVRLLAGGLADDQGIAAVATDQRGEELLAACEAAAGDAFRGGHVGVIDCLGDQAGESDHPSVRRVGSPSDVTGIGMQLSRLWDGLGTRAVDGVRTGVVDVSTIVRYAGRAPVFRFLHMVTGRVGGDGLGVYVLYPDTHDSEVVGSLRPLFDGQIEVRHDAGLAVRARGLADQPTEWRPVDDG